jgi:hypothetical protein
MDKQSVHQLIVIDDQGAILGLLPYRSHNALSKKARPYSQLLS